MRPGPFWGLHSNICHAKRPHEFPEVSLLPHWSHCFKAKHNQYPSRTSTLLSEIGIPVTEGTFTVHRKLTTQNRKHVSMPLPTEFEPSSLPANFARTTAKSINAIVIRTCIRRAEVSGCRCASPAHPVDISHEGSRQGSGYVSSPQNRLATTETEVKYFGQASPQVRTLEWKAHVTMVTAARERMLRRRRLSFVSSFLFWGFVRLCDL